MMYQARVIGPNGTVEEKELPSKYTSLFVQHPIDNRTVYARLVRELPPEDGGPLLIYKIGDDDALAY